MQAGFRRFAVTALLMLFSTAVSAKTTTINDITLDVPDDYKVANSKRGILVTSKDGEVDLWIELFSAADQPTVFEEHMNYWKKKDVDLHGDGETTKTKSGERDTVNTKFPDATWKGDPTVLHYSANGPFGPQNWTLLLTYWASPQGDRQHGDEINKMVSDIKFDFPN